MAQAIAAVVAAFFSRVQTAEVLGVHVNTVDREIRAGRLRAGRIGSRVVISQQALEEYRERIEAGI